LGDRALVDAVCHDHMTAPIGDAEKALFTFVAKVNARPWEVTQEGVDAARGAGWSDEALYDAFTVCALFNFYNRWVDAFGGHGISEEAQRMTGKRLAQGYVTGSR
jgi:alkylhydroperoxidase family enzyme